jgi:diguanylate cyclase (GGDEF)-like protein
VFAKRTKYRNGTGPFSPGTCAVTRRPFLPPEIIAKGQHWARRKGCVDAWRKGTLKSLVIPGGVLLLVAAMLLQGGLLSISASTVSFYYFSVFVAGILLAWRFHSSRILFALLSLFLAHRAVEFFSVGRAAAAGPGHIALEAVAFLLPLNFVAFSLMAERGLALPSIASRLALLFFESVFVAVLCRPGTATGPSFLNSDFIGRNPSHWILSPIVLLAFLVAFGILLSRFLFYRKPLESGLLWSLAATLTALEAGGVGRIAGAYVATAGLILVSSIIENSYFLAYHDELTSLQGRRAFNETLPHLEEPYAVAVVDVDHFKRFNDTYGHDTGDQVLRMVASRLSSVTGGGRAFRIGGEEFSILFEGKSPKEALPHLDQLRITIEESVFHVRGVQERRRHPSDPSRINGERRGASRDRLQRSADQGDANRGSSDRRSSDRRSASRRRAVRATGMNLRDEDYRVGVTVSIGVAGPGAKTRNVEQVIQAADKALYRAKQVGRNRVEVASPARASRSAKSSVA